MTCLPAHGSANGTRHWLFCELLWQFTPAIWSGTSWYVEGIDGPQHPEEMYEEWSFEYVGPVDQEDDEPSPQMVADYFRATIKDPVALYEALSE